MSEVASPFDDVFLLNLGNRAFVRGESSRLTIPPFSVRRAVTLFLFRLIITLPFGIIAGIVVALLTATYLLHSITLMTLIMVLFLAAKSVDLYLNSRRIEKSGQLVKGEIVKYDSRKVIGTKGIKPFARMHYTISLPDGSALTLNNIVSESLTHLHDGRPLPPPGTQVAVLYVNEISQLPL